jgi:hypothetical protein
MCHCMQIVVEFHLSVDAYAAGYAALTYPRPETCPNCGTAGQLEGHGFYWRYPLDVFTRFEIGIKRWCCRACGKTTSLLPSFLLRFRWYLLAVIQSVVVARFETRQSWRQIETTCTANGAPSGRTIKRWCRSFARHAPAWLAAAQQTLAEFEPAAPGLDPLGAAAGPVTPAPALLEAALQLLAWAKTRWADLAGFGRADRLRFLWHWGYGRGLARLI